MKITYLISFLLFLLPFNGRTQIIVSNELFRNLYQGVENPISLTVLNVPESQLVIRSNSGSIQKVSKTKYYWKICTSEKQFVHLEVYNKTKLVDSIAFKILYIPDPIMLVANQDGELFFKGASGVRPDIKNFVMEGVQCKIEKFKVSVTKSSGKIIELENIGAFYKTATHNIFEALEVGDKVLLSDFVVTVGCETTPRKLTQVLSSVYSGKKYELRH